MNRFRGTKSPQVFGRLTKISWMTLVVSGVLVAGSFAPGSFAPGSFAPGVVKGPNSLQPSNHGALASQGTPSIFDAIRKFGELDAFRLASNNAHASVTPALDTDHDLLSDAFEVYFGTNPTNKDSDGDLVPDGIEYVLRYDPMDPLVKGPILPGFGMSSLATDTELKLTLYFVPGSEQILDDFLFIVRSGATADPNGGWADVSTLIPYAVSEIGYSYYEGFLTTAYTISIPIATLELLAPLSFGGAANLAGMGVADIIVVDVVDGVPIVVKIPTPEEGLTQGNDYWAWEALTDDVPAGWDAEKTCVTKQIPVPSENGVFIRWEIVEASCVQQTNRACPGDCDQLGGETGDGGFFISLDYGYLLSLLGGF